MVTLQAIAAKLPTPLGVAQLGLRLTMSALLNWRCYKGKSSAPKRTMGGK